MGRQLCTMCQLIETPNELCHLCNEKGYPSKISAVYPESSIKQRLATHAFNVLANLLDSYPREATALANEFGVTEVELHAAMEELYTEN